MIGSLDPKEKKVSIVGGGISGLLMGYTLKKRGFQVTIYEASSRVGGLIETRQTEFGPVETAAHSILVNEEVKQLFDELNVELLPVQEKSKARFIYRNHKMRRMPLHFIELLGTLIRFFSRPKFMINERSTLSEWCLAYLGKPALDFLLSPFLTGVFAATPQELNAKITFPKLIPNPPGLSLYQWFRMKKKSKRAQMMAPKNGMGEVIEKLTQSLNENIVLNHPIHSLDQINGNIVLSIPTSELSKLISKVDPHSAELLLKVRYAPLITATCFYPQSAFQKPPCGVGVLIPRGEGLRILGCLFNSSSFKNRVKSMRHSSFTVMMGGTTDPESLLLTDDQVRNVIENEMKTLLGVKTAASYIELTCWNRAIPVYSSELAKAQESLRVGFCSAKGRLILSNYSKEVSIRGIIEALHHL